MDKSRIMASAILAVAIVIFGVLIMSALNNFTNKDRRVTVKGLSEMELPADEVTWNFSTSYGGNSVQETYSALNRVKNRLSKFLTDNGIPEKDIYFGSPSVTDMEQYNYSNRPVPYKYKLTLSATVHSKEVDKVREVISRQGELIEKEGIVLDGGYDYYSLSNFSEVKPQMMEEAIQNAQATAEQFAKNSHSRLGKIVSAGQGQFSMDGLNETTPYIIKLRVVSTITYSLKN